MMLNINLESRGEERKSLTLVGSGIVVLTMLCLSTFLPQTGSVPAGLLDFQGFGWASLFDGLNSLETLGQILFTKGFLLFLIAGLILLIALVGSIVLTLQTRQDVKKQTVSHQRSRDPDNSVFLVDLDPTVTSKNNLLLYSFVLYFRFKNILTRNGKNPDKVLNAMHKSLKESGVQNPSKILPIVVRLLSLPLEVKKRRRGRNHLQIPFPISKYRQEGIVLHKLVKGASSKRLNSKFGERLAFHMLQTLRGSGTLVQERSDLLRVLKLGRPFAHMRWRLFHSKFYNVNFESIGTLFS
jgi:ribosomal protein S7